jgi:hypothetical protein
MASTPHATRNKEQSSVFSLQSSVFSVFKTENFMMENDFNSIQSNTIQSNPFLN